MQLIYNSDNYVVVVFEATGPDGASPPGAAGALSRPGYEIVDKFKRKEIFIEGAVAESFHQGVQALVDQGPTEEAMDDFISGFTTLAQQPVLLH